MSYHTLVANISRVHQETLAGAAGAVNRHLLLRNWLIGAYLVEFEQRADIALQTDCGRSFSVEGTIARRFGRLKISYR